MKHKPQNNPSGPFTPWTEPYGLSGRVPCGALRLIDESSVFMGKTEKSAKGIREEAKS